MPSHRKLPDWIDGYLDFTSNTEPDRILHEWVAVSVIASALQRKCFLKLGILTIYPNFYIILTTPPGFRKGTAMDIGESLLRGVGGNIRLSSSATSKEALLKRLAGCLVMEPPLPDGTIVSHSSLTIYSEELTVFLGYNNVNLMSYLCNWFDCKDVWSDDTIKHGTQEILNLWVNLLGATTPDLVQTTLPRDTIGGGLTSRMIFVYSDRKNLVVYPSITQDQADIYQGLSIDLERIHLLKGQFRFTQDWLDAYTDWRVSEEKNPSVTHPYLAYYNQRRAVHIMKLSMVMCASRSDDMVIEGMDLERAVELLHRTERRMPRVFSGMGKSSVAEVMSRVMAFIANKEKTTTSEILTHFLNDLEGQDQLDEIIKTLTHIGFCVRSFSSNGDDKILYKKTGKMAEQFTPEKQKTT